MNAIHAQFIEENGERRFVVLPVAEYEALLERLDEVEAVRAFDAAKDKAEETFPEEAASRLIAGDHPVRVFRDYRGLSVRALAKLTGLSPAYLSDIENGKRGGTVDTLRMLAEALGLQIDDLV